MFNKRKLIWDKLQRKNTDKIPFTMYKFLLPYGQEERELREQGLAVIPSQYIHEEINPNTRISRSKEFKGSKLTIKETWENCYGKVTKKSRIEPGHQSEFIVEHFIEEDPDYKVVEKTLKERQYIPSFEKYNRGDERLGEDGIYFARGKKTPYQRAFVEHTGIEKLSYDLHKEKEEVFSFLETLQEKHLELINTIAESKAKLIHIDDNITAPMIGKDRFNKYCKPAYKKYTDIFAQTGKKIIVHMDGKLSDLSEEIANSHFPVVEAFTPPPDGDMKVETAIELWDDKVIWMNYPASILIKPKKEIAAFTKNLVEKIGDADNVILGITEDVPEEKIYPSVSTILSVLYG